MTPTGRNTPIPGEDISVASNRVQPIAAITAAVVAPPSDNTRITEVSRKISPTNRANSCTNAAGAFPRVAGPSPIPIKMR